MTEASFWKKVKPMLKEAGLDPIRVENAAHIGTPDVNYTGGWIELKHTTRLPKLDQMLRIPHFTPEQRVWLARRCHNGGKAFVLMQVGTHHFLMDGMIAARILGDCKMQKVVTESIGYWPGPINKKELIILIT